MNTLKWLRTTAFLLSATGGSFAVAAVYHPKTLSEASNLPLQPGDYVYFDRGATYTGTLTINKSGAPGAPITYTMYGSTGDRPHLDANGAPFGILNVDHSYINIDHLQVQNATQSCIASVQMQDNRAGVYSEYLVLTNNFVQNCGDSAQPGYGGGPPYYGEAGIYVVGFASSNQHGLAGIVIDHNQCWNMKMNVGGDDGRACFLVDNAQAPQITWNSAYSVTVMGIAVRHFANNTAGDSAYIAHNDLRNNEGNITSWSNHSTVEYNTVTNSRGFGAQAYPGSTIQNNSFSHLSISTNHALYNGIDENDLANLPPVYSANYKGVSILNNTFSDIYGCEVTMEQMSPGSTISGNTFDASSNSGCPLFVMQPSIPGLVLGENTFILNDSITAVPFNWNAPNYNDNASYHLSAGSLLRQYPFPMDGTETTVSGCKQQISKGQFVPPLCPDLPPVR